MNWKIYFKESLLKNLIRSKRARSNKYNSWDNSIYLTHSSPYLLVMKCQLVFGPRLKNSRKRVVDKTSRLLLKDVRLLNSQTLIWSTRWIKFLRAKNRKTTPIDSSMDQDGQQFHQHLAMVNTNKVSLNSIKRCKWLARQMVKFHRNSLKTSRDLTFCQKQRLNWLKWFPKVKLIKLLLRMHVLLAYANLWRS